MSAPVAYSLLRFSTPEQADGDSVRRQMKYAEDFARSEKVRLDTSLTKYDPSVSGWSGKAKLDPERYPLAAFLALIKAGKVKAGDFLVVESLDRITRENTWDALTLMKDIVTAGVRVVQMSPSLLIIDRKSPPMVLMMMVMTLCRANEESEVKSDRVGQAWGEKKRKARESRVILTKKAPAWLEVLEEVRGKEVVRSFRVVKEKVKAVRRVFQLAAQGLGHALIVKTLTKEGVPPVGEGGRARWQVVEGRRKRVPVEGASGWVRSYVGKLLTDRRVLGEFQPRKRDGSEDGEVIKDYFPAVITEDEFYAARKVAQDNQGKSGRTGEGMVNVFAGLLRETREGGTLYACRRVDGHKPGRRGGTHHVLLPTASAEGKAKCHSFPYRPFCDLVLGALAELDPQEVLGESAEGVTVRTLNGELADIDTERGKINQFMDAHGFDPDLGARLKKLNGRRVEVLAEIQEAKAREANPVSESWGEARSLILSMAHNNEEAPKLRAALRRVVKEVWCYFWSVGKVRLALVEVFFNESQASRRYTLVYRPPIAGFKKSLKPALTGFFTSTTETEFTVKDLAQAELQAQVVGSVIKAGNLDKLVRLSRLVNEPEDSLVDVAE